MDEKRIDTVDGKAYSYEEISAHYSGTCKKKDIERYWAKMKPVAKRKGKGKGKSKTEATAKAAVKAKAKPKANAEADEPQLAVGVKVKARPPGKSAIYTGDVVEIDKTRGKFKAKFGGMGDVWCPRSSLISISGELVESERKRLEAEAKAKARKQELDAAKNKELKKRFPPDARVKVSGCTSLDDGTRGTVRRIDERNLVEVVFDIPRNFSTSPVKFVPDKSLRVFQPMPVVEPPAPSGTYPRVAQVTENRDLMFAAFRGLDVESRKMFNNSIPEGEEPKFCQFNRDGFYGRFVVIHGEENGIALVHSPTDSEIKSEDLMKPPQTLSKIPAAAMKSVTEEQFMDTFKARKNELEKQEADRKAQAEEAERKQKEACARANAEQRAIMEQEAAETEQKEHAKANRFAKRMKDVDEWSAVDVEISMLSGSVLKELKLPPDVAVIDVRDWLIQQSEGEEGLLKELLHGGASIVTTAGVCDGSGTEAGKMLLGDLKNADGKVGLKVVLHRLPCAGESFYVRGNGGDQWCRTWDEVQVTFDEAGHNAKVKWETGYHSDRYGGLERGELDGEVRYDAPKIRIRKKRGRKACKQDKDGKEINPDTWTFYSDTDAVKYVPGQIDLECEYNPEEGVKFETKPQAVCGHGYFLKQWLKKADTSKLDWSIKF